MTPEGRTKILTALEQAGIPSDIRPIPEPDQDVAYLTIRMNQYPDQLSGLLIALGEAGLMKAGDPRDDMYRTDPYAPALSFVASETVSIPGASCNSPLQPAARFVTFQDHNLGNSLLR
ncbi:MAG TPA: hypothetical protein VMR45_04530 [Patescibacteria group bacterium]|nr:hypothetical protein [Patescibacteria group bacterium]